MAIDLLNPLDRTSPTFRADVDSLFSGGLNAAIAQMNATEGNMSAFVAGGAYAFQYAFDSSTANADPGVGKLRLGSSTQNVSTVLRIDNAMSGGADLSSVWTDLLSVASSMKGSIRIVKAADVSKWMVLDVTGSTAATGYRNLSVSVRAFSDANPFANGDALMVYIQRAGDVSSGAMIKLADVTISSPVALVNFLSIFRPDCNKYIIEVEGFTPSSSVSLAMRMAVGGVAQTGSNYYAGSAGSTMTASAQFILSGSLSAGAVASGQACTVEVRNTNSPANSTMSARGVSGASNSGISVEGYFSTSSPTSGFQLFSTGGANTIAGSIRVYGILN